MFFSEFITYLEAYLFEKLEKVVIEALIAIITKQISTSKRGILDNHMTGLANNFKIACPRCKTMGSWEAFPEEIKGVIEKEGKNIHV